MNNKHWSMATALEQIAKCGFSCEAGAIENNAAWAWLTAAAKVGPQFWPGQGAWFEIEAEAAGKKLTQWAHFYIVGCQMQSDITRRYWTYDLSYDPPSPYHYGTTHFKGVEGYKLSLTKPVEAVAA